MVQAGELLAGRYRIEQPLGAGGMGAVFVAQDEKLGRQVALKTISAGCASDEVARRRMLREARTAAGFEHPGIAQVYDVGESDGGELFVVMELVRGRTVRALAEEGLSRDETLRIVEELATTLDAAHRAGLIHRDVKPENVMVRDDGRVTLLDFGLAKPIDPQVADTDLAAADTASLLTGAGAIVGTPAYLAPEQACGEPGPASDQWALAVMAFELLVGRLPWSGRNPTQLLAQILGEDPPKASALADLPEAVDEVLARGLAKEPAERFEGAGELARTLANALGEQSSTSSAIRPAERDTGADAEEAEQTELSVEAKPTAAHGGFFRVALLAVGGLGFALWAAWSATQARDGDGATQVSPATASAHTVWTATKPPPRETRLTRTADANLVHNGMLTRDGKEVLWVDSEGIWRRPRTGGDPVRVPLPADVPPNSRKLWDVFDGGQMLVLGANNHVAPLVTLDCRNQRVQRVRENAFVGFVSHDERWLAFADAQGLAVIALDGTGLRRLADAGQGHVVMSIAWAPDDEVIAFRRREFTTASGPETVELVARDGSWQRRIAEGPRMALTTLATVAWLEPTGVVYAKAGPAGTWDTELWAQPVRQGQPSGEARRLYIWPEQLVGHLVARSRALTYVRQTPRIHVHLLSLEEGSGPAELRRLTDDEHHDRSASWSAAGEVLFSSNRRGRWDVFAQRPGEPTARLVAGGPLWETWPSSDGLGGVVFFQGAVDEDGRISGGRLSRVPPDGGPPTPWFDLPDVPAARPNGWPPGWSRRVQCTRQAPPRCVSSSLVEGKLRLHELDPHSGTVGKRLGELTPPGGSLVAWSLAPQGDRIAVAGAVPEISLLSLDSGAQHTVRAQLEPATIVGVAWDHRGEALFVTGLPLGPARGGIGRFALDGTVEVLHRSDTSKYSFPAVSPDGRWLAVTQLERPGDLWMLEGL